MEAILHRVAQSPFSVAAAAVLPAAAVGLAHILDQSTRRPSLAAALLHSLRWIS